MVDRNGLDRRELAHGLWAALAVRRVLFIALSLIVLQLGLASAAQAEPMPSGVPGTWQLKLNEEFTSSGLNTALWTPSLGSTGIGYMSGQCVAPQRVKQPGDGYLHLQLAAEAACPGQNITGALVESSPSNGVPGHTGFQYTEGYVEWRVFSPAAENGELADWPGLWSRGPSGGNLEIDTFEGLHGKANFHFWWHPEAFQEGGPTPHQGYAGGWHTYGVDWEHGVLTFYYDGVMVGQLANPRILAHTEPQDLLMDLVAPGSYGGPLTYGEMKVDYVRVWQHPPQNTFDNTWAITTPDGSNNNVLYRNTSGQLDDEYWLASTGWANTVLANNMSGTAAALDGGNGTNPNVFYENTSGQLVDEYSTPATGWTNTVLAGNINGTPAAILTPDNSNMNVLYKNTSGQLDDEYWFASAGWANTVLANNMSGNPAALENPNGTNPNVFYENTSGQLVDEYSTPATGWTNTVLAGNINGTPAAIISPNGSNMNVLYKNTSGQLDDEYWFASTGWANTVLASGISSTPAVLERENGNNPNVFYENTSGQLVDENSTPATGWTNTVLAGNINGTPAAMVSPDGSNMNVLYRNTSGQLDDEYWVAGTGWANTVLANGMAGP